MSLEKGNFVALTRCYFCGEADKILLHQRFGDMSKYDNQVVDKEPCPKCADLMKKGVMFIEVREEPKNPEEEPYRTGRLWVLRDEAVSRIFRGEVVDQALKRRAVFIPTVASFRVFGPPEPESPDAPRPVEEAT